MPQKTALSFEGISESGNQFLALFPHRYDYIWAEHVSPHQSPNWKTESRHALSDRLIQQGAYLYGVRFGKETNYCLVDIDIESPYHPQQDPFAIGRIVAALEPLGLVRYVACTSSYSGGLHLYFPFSKAQETWSLAIVLSTLLENAGFKLLPGQLEIFPNSRTYIVDSTPTLFNAHRLPMQIGSYLLNDGFEPICSDQHTFIQHWQLAQDCNCLDSKTLHRLLKQFQRKHYRVTGKAEKFVNDLSAEIEFGWTGFGQTNRLLGRIAMRAYIFHHVLYGGEPLEGQRLVEAIVHTAKSLPGYQQWCRHQHEIDQRAAEWARCIENSRYFHYGEASGKYKPPISEEEPQLPRIDWNQKQSQAARERIRFAIADLLEKQRLPSGATARFQELLKYGVGGASLYRHRDLWHPNYLTEPSADSYQTGFEDQVAACLFSTGEETSGKDFESDFVSNQLDCAGGASNWQSNPSLLQETGSNPAKDRVSSDRPSYSFASSGSNSGSVSEDLTLLSCSGDNEPLILDRSTWLEIRQEASKTVQQQVQRHRSRFYSPPYIARLQHYLDSGDPILVAEAQAWAERNPGVLDLKRINLSLQMTSTAIERNQSRNVADLLAAIAVYTQRLQWTPEQIGQKLRQLFGKSSLACLEDMELVAWRLWLEAQC